MRLINADELKEKLSQQWFIDILLTKTSSNDMFSALADMIDSQLTTYDVDKVVGQLEELKSQVPVNRILDDIIKDKPKELGQLIAYDKAIEIVKAGGNVELSEHSESQGNRTGKQKATIEAEPKAE